MSSTIWNVASSPLLKNAIAAKQKAVATMPDMTFTRRACRAGG